MPAKSTNTIQDIEEALILLCASLPFEKNTVKHICERAGVSKQTFYNHFQDKYEVAAKIYEEDIGMKDQYFFSYSSKNEVFYNTDPVRMPVL